MKKDIITVAGDLGAGKGVSSKIVAKKLNYEYFSTGDIARSIATKNNMSIYEWNKAATENPELDYEVDSELKRYLKEHTNIIIDSRMAWFFGPESFKVYLKVDIQESAKRILHSGRLDEKYNSLEEAVSIISARKEVEDKRYLELYGADKTNMNNFDLVIDTTNISAEEVSNIIIKEYLKWRSS